MACFSKHQLSLPHQLAFSQTNSSFSMASLNRTMSVRTHLNYELVDITAKSFSPQLSWRALGKDRRGKTAVSCIRERAASSLCDCHRVISKSDDNPVSFGVPFERSSWQKQGSGSKGLVVVSAASSASFGREIRDDGIFISRGDLQIAMAAASTVIFAVANKVLYKMALVPLKEFPFFLALFNTFGYVIVYFSILYMRYRAGIVTDEMLRVQKHYFALSGALEAIGLASGMAAAAVLPGPSIAILLQTFLVWQLVLSIIFLKKHYSPSQISGCMVVLTGVLTALSGTGTGLHLAAGQTHIVWPLLMIVSCAFQASSTIVKEFVFRNAPKHLKGGSLDIFVVNSFGSAFQAIFVLGMLPFLSQMRGIPFNQLGNYLTHGAGCLFSFGSNATECSGSTLLLTLSYVAVNLAFNISLLSLLKLSSAVGSSLCSTVAVPLAIYIFTLPLPFVGASGALHPRFLLGTVILLSGLALYNSSFFKSSLKSN